MWPALYRTRKLRDHCSIAAVRLHLWSRSAWIGQAPDEMAFQSKGGIALPCNALDPA